MRLFVSIDLPPELTPAIEEIQGELRPASGLDLTDPSQAHVTLKFLGEVDPSRQAEVETALSAAVDETELDPFEAEFEGLGAFPSEEYIRVVWLGVSRGSEAMTTLHEAIEQNMVSLGFDPEDHDFTPHVTLGRMNHAGGKELVQNVLKDADPVAGRMQVEAVRLTESELGPDGPEYSTVSSVPLGE